MEQVKRLASVAGLASLLCAVACAAQITDAPGEAAAGNAGTGNVGTGAAPSTTTGGTPTIAGAGGAGAGTSSTSGGASVGGATGVAQGGGGQVASGGAPIVTTPPANPGVVVARRLNRTEYNNTVRDLLGTSLTPASDFPADDLGGDFDTVGSALSLSPAYVMAYEKAAQALTTELFADANRKAKVVTCNIETAGNTCAETVLGTFARRAWRRAATPEELTALMAPIAKAQELGLTATEGLRSALTAVLISPFFVFKLEIDPDPNSAAPRRLSGQELATRLAYALWATMPDDALNQAADAGQLASDEQVAAQVERMLTDARSDALLDGFAGRWLSYGNLESHEVEAAKVPKYTPALLRSMKTEAMRFVRDFLNGAQPAERMLDARFTYVDSALASFYGLSAAGASATNFVRVDTSNVPRAGLLTLGAMLTTTSHAARTSPVRRGEFVFSHLLCSAVPPPPPDVPALPETVTTTATMRQRLEQHRADPACSGCHTLMDPIGFGLENYDAIGGYRTMDAGATIDATGTLPDGRTFNGAIELGGLLASDPRFPGCVTQKFMTYAIGRILNQPDDSAWVSYLSAQSRNTGGSLRQIIKAVLVSDAFRSRQQQPL